MNILVTGGAGFIGSNFLRDWITSSSGMLVNLDKLTYAGNLNNLDGLDGSGRYHFVHGDIGDEALVLDVLKRNNIDAVVNFAAESHVDRSIHGPDAFIQTNVVGTFHLLRPQGHIGSLESPLTNRNLGFSMFRLMKFMEHSTWVIQRLRSRIDTNRIAHTLQARLLQITLSGHITTPMDYQYSPLTALTIMVLTSFQRS